MKISFDADKGLIIVEVAIESESSEISLNLALDTGATATLVSKDKLLEIGCDLNEATEFVPIVTGSRVEIAAQIIVSKVIALGREKENFAIIAHNLPPEASVDGVLGLDFLQDYVLKIDFKQGFIELD